MVETSKQPVALDTTTGFSVAISICLAMIGSAQPAQRRWPSVNLVLLLGQLFQGCAQIRTPMKLSSFTFPDISFLNTSFSSSGLTSLPPRP